MNGSGNESSPSLIGRLRRFTLTGRQRAPQSDKVQDASSTGNAGNHLGARLKYQIPGAAKSDEVTVKISQAEERQALSDRLGEGSADLTDDEKSRIDSSVAPSQPLFRGQHEAYQSLILNCNSEVFEDAELQTFLDQQSGSGVMRVFLSSSFTDWVWERDVFHLFYLPKLRAAALRKGLEFQLVDPNMGRNEAHALSQVHGATSRRWQLGVTLDAPQHSKTGVHFVGLVGDKYGPQVLPRHLDLALYEALFSACDSPRYQTRIEKVFTGMLRGAMGFTATEEGRTRVLRLQSLQRLCRTKAREKLAEWYALDENSLPAEYVLRPVWHVLPGFDPQERDLLFEEYLEEHYEPLVQILAAAAFVLTQKKDKGDLHFTEAHLLALMRSVTHDEMLAAATQTSATLDLPPGSAWDTRGECYRAHGAAGALAMATGAKPRAVENRALFVFRKLEGVPAVTAEHMIFPSCRLEVGEAAYIEGGVDKGKLARKQLDSIRSQITKHVKKKQLSQFSVRWSKDHGGFNPLLSRDHMKYVQQVCDALYKRLLDDICAAPSRVRSRFWSPEEPIAHVNYSRKLLQMFGARHDTALHIAKALRHPSATVCLQGIPGGGKSVLLAKVLELVASAVEATQEDASVASQAATSTWTVVPRFIGKTAESTTEWDLVKGLCLHITQAYLPDVDMGRVEDSLPPTFDQLCQHFQSKVLTLSSADQPLLVVLDGLDVLVPAAGDALQLAHWFPQFGLPHVRVLCATRNTDHVRDLKSRRRRQKRQAQAEQAERLGTEAAAEHGSLAPFLEIISLKFGSFSVHEAGHMLNTWLSQDNRALVGENQRAVVLKVVKRAQDEATPLLLRAVYSMVREWCSFDLVGSEEAGALAIQNLLSMKTCNTGVVVKAWFSAMEQCHHPRLVAAVFGTISVSRDGLTLSELEDILALDNALLEVLFAHAVPVLPRVPTAMVLALLDQSRDFVECHQGVYRWTHQQFAYAAKARYAPDNTRDAQLTCLADYFAGFSSTLMSVSEPFVLSRAVSNVVWELDTDRGVATQPHMYSALVPNRRKARELPFALASLLGQSQLTLSLSELLVDLGFLLVALECGALQDLLRYCRVTAQSPSTPEADACALGLLHSALTLSAPAVLKDSRELVSQLVGRLRQPPPDCPKVDVLLLQAKSAASLGVPRWEPLKSALRRAGGWEAPEEPEQSQRPFESAAFSADGQWVACGGLDKTVRVWSTATAEPRVFPGLDDAVAEPLDQLQGHRAAVSCVAFSPSNPEIASGSRDRTVRVWDMESGSVVRSLDAKKPVTALAWDSSGSYIAAAGSLDKLYVWDRGSGNLEATAALGGVHSKDVLSLSVAVPAKPGAPALVASAGWDGVVALWALPRPKRKAKGAEEASAHVELSKPKWTARPVGGVCWSVEIMPNGKFVHVHEPHSTTTLAVSSGRVVGSEHPSPCRECLALGRTVPLTSYADGTVQCPVLSGTEVVLPLRQLSKTSVASTASQRPAPGSAARRPSAKELMGLPRRASRRRSKNNLRRGSAKLPPPVALSSPVEGTPLGVGYTVDLGVPKRASCLALRSAKGPLLSCVIGVDGVHILEQVDS